MMLSSWIDRHTYVASDGIVPALHRRWLGYRIRLMLPLYSVRGKVSNATKNQPISQGGWGSVVSLVVGVTQGFGC